MFMLIKRKNNSFVKKQFSFHCYYTQDKIGCKKPILPIVKNMLRILEIYIEKIDDQFILKIISCPYPS
jgi:hypothetical protein